MGRAAIALKSGGQERKMKLRASNVKEVQRGRATMGSNLKSGRVESVHKTRSELAA